MPSTTLDNDSFRILRIENKSGLVLESPKRIEKNGPSLFLNIDASTCLVKDHIKAFPDPDFAIQSTHDICGVIGIVDLVFSRHLLAVTEKVLAATIQDHKIYKIVRAEAFQISVAAGVDDPDYKAKILLDNELLSSISEIFNSRNLYFSTTYDLTLSLQHAHLRKNDGKYWFNEYLQQPILNALMDNNPWQCKIIAGFAGSIDIKQASTLTATLISRVSTRRLGCRYVRRGLDMQGNAANTVEMEQICFAHDYRSDKMISSFVQIRGSAPAIWTQKLDTSYKPEMKISDISKSWKSISAHFTDLKSLYTDPNSVVGVVCVNLLDDKGFEGSLTETYEAAVTRFADSSVQYEGFPINKWCRKYNFRNMDILLNRMTSRLLNSGVFLAQGPVPSLSGKSELKVIQLQIGVTRTSCLDSLDRTNLTCSLFAKFMLPFQIDGQINRTPTSQLSVDTRKFPAESPLKAKLINTFPRLVNLWADSGDAISILYAGTGALKADVVRTGQRQWIKGSLDDGLNSIARYYANNFRDGRKQDSYDLITGKINTKQMLAASLSQSTISKPIITKDKGLGYFLPPFLVDRIDPLLKASIEYTGTSLTSKIKQQEIADDSNSYFGYIVNAIKLYAPQEVGRAVDLVASVALCVYLLALVKLTQNAGDLIVDVPKLQGFEEILEDLD